MMKRVIALYGFIAAFIWSITSCNHYIDTAKGSRSVKFAEGNLVFYPDSNILNFRSSAGIRLDTQRYSSMPFVAKLPKGIKWWDVSLPYWFVFYYDNNQAVIINVDYHHLGSTGSASYVPSDSGIDSVKRETSVDGDKKYDFRRISSSPKRKTLMIRKDAARILLYNVKPNKYDAFVSDLREFKFVR